MDKGLKLERMANEIAAFFRAYPHDEAVAGVRDHIEAFWAPVMRRDLAAHLAAGAPGLDPIALEAVTDRATATSPTARETAGPATAGELGASDAG